MPSTSKPSRPRPDTTFLGVTLLPLLRGADGAADLAKAPAPRHQRRVVSIVLCPRRNRLTMGFRACGVPYVGEPGTEDPLEAAATGSALRDAIEARLKATGFMEVLQAIRQLELYKAATPTRRADRAMLLGIATAMVRSAPRAVAEVTATDGERPSWSVRTSPSGVIQALR